MFFLNMSCHLPITKYKGAVIQYAPTLFEKEDNISDLLNLTKDAAMNGAKIILMPEMATTGYCFFNRADIAPYVESVPGPTTDEFGKLSRKYNVYIGVSLPEVDLETNIYYNTMALLDPSESIIGKYRKVH